MTEPGPKPESQTPRRKRRVLRAFLYLFIVCLIVLGAFGWYVSTDSFQQMARARFVEELQTITGGRVEIGSIHATPLKLRVEVRNLTVHGLEPANEAPLARFDSIRARVKLT